VPWWCWILLLVLAEALAIMVLLPTSWSNAVGNGDGAEYQRYAFNLLHHGVFSERPSAPYYPGVVRSAGYPVVLAALEWIGGRHAMLVQAFQFGLIALMAVIVGLIGREVGGRGLANVAAVLCATYLPFLGLATVFLTEVLISCLLSGVVLLVLRARQRQAMKTYLAIGLLLSIAAYVRPEFIVLLVPIEAVLLLTRWFTGNTGMRLRAGAVLALALVIPLVPWLVRDASVSGEVLPMAANGGSDLLASADQYTGFLSAGFDLADVNRYDAQVARLTGVPAAARGLQATVENADARRQVQVDAQERSKASALIKSVSVATILARMPKRVVYSWATADVSPPPSAGTLWHRLAQLQYAFLVVAGLLGVFARRRHLLDEWPLWFIGVYLTLAHLVFHVEARYTLPARPMLMVYAAAGTLIVTGWLRRRIAPRLRWTATVATPLHGRS
jgi:4-amino-4-deoxy-L-arabinose transferase-like glycosyltransferase